MNGSTLTIYVNVAAFLFVFLMIVALWRPLQEWILEQEYFIGRTLQVNLLLDVSPRSITWLSVAVMAILAVFGYGLFSSLLAAVILAGVGAALPVAVIKYLRYSRQQQLDDQLIAAVESLASGVRAGLNLVQSMELVANNMPQPVSQEFAHLLREYEYGNPLDEAMASAAARVQLPNYRLLFSALRTHRHRGGDLGQTLDKIADSLREIQRLEKRVETLTAQNRTAARWMGAMPLVILGILYVIDPSGVSQLFEQDMGRLILFGVAMLNLVGFLWIRQLVNIDI